MYSQHNEEKIILDFFRGKTGTFLDLGAFNGVDLSNVRALAELGWSGVCVEASPTVFLDLQKNYEGFDKIELFNLAVCNLTGTFEFFDNHNAVGTLYKKETERWKGKEKFNIIKVDCIEVKEFLNLCRYKTFDFLSCDIEGEDLNVISRLNFDTLKTKMICVEFNGKDKNLYDDILLPYSFKLVHRNGENLIYSRL